jgi:hypothetical protein
VNRSSYPRRYDLDVLRATAMLLGIVLHAGLSFTPFPWAVQDERQSDFFWLLFAAIHGSRMPVFFVLSGFFTAMLWRGRGLEPVLSHRFRRVLLPFLLGLVTIVPAVNWISGWAIASGLEANAVKAEEDNIWSAARDGDPAAVERHLQGGADIDGTDPAFGQTPLVWAALVGQLEVVDPSLARSPRPSIADLPISRPLHLAGPTAERSPRPSDELALHSHVPKRILVSAVRHIIEENETHLIETVVRFEELLHRIERDDCRLRDWITINAGADGWEGNRLDVVIQCES